MSKRQKPEFNPAGLRGPEWEWADEVSLGTGGLPGTAETLWENIGGHAERPAAEVPVVHDVDVAVVGGGVAGTIAAIAAARHGADTLVIDRFFAVADVDYERYQQAIGERGELAPEDRQWADDHEAAPYMPWVREAWEADEFYIIDVVDDFATLEIMLKPPDPTQPHMQLGRTRVNGNWNPGDALALSRINQRMHPYIYHFVEFLRGRVPGYEKTYLHIVSPFTHARGGKCIEAEYSVTGDDVSHDARFDDVVYKFWGTTRDGCDIPDRAMIPKDIDGLMAAGKSAMNRGPQFRSRYSCQLMGQVLCRPAARLCDGLLIGRGDKVELSASARHRHLEEVGLEAEIPIQLIRLGEARLNGGDQAVRVADQPPGGIPPLPRCLNPEHAVAVLEPEKLSRELLLQGVEPGRDGGQLRVGQEAGDSAQEGEGAAVHEGVSAGLYKGEVLQRLLGQQLLVAEADELVRDRIGIQPEILRF